MRSVHHIFFMYVMLPSLSLLCFSVLPPKLELSSWDSVDVVPCRCMSVCLVSATSWGQLVSPSLVCLVCAFCEWQSVLESLNPRDTSTSRCWPSLEWPLCLLMQPSLVIRKATLRRLRGWVTILVIKYWSFSRFCWKSSPVGFPFPNLLHVNGFVGHLHPGFLQKRALYSRSSHKL